MPVCRQRSSVIRPPPSWRESQSRASRQSRSTVTTETAAATSGDGHPAEVPQGHHLDLPPIQLGQPVQGLGDRDDLHPAELSLLLLGHVQIGNRSLESLGGHADGLGERRVGMDGQADVLSIRAHLDSERRLGD